jgi:FOG: WD40-like repeat
MRIRNNKTKTLAICLLFAISIMTSMMLVSETSAHAPAWNIPTFAYISASPNPIGVGQQALIVFWLTNTYDSAAVTNNYRFHNYKLTITAPDGTNTSQTFETITDSTSSQFTQFTPTQVGTYTLSFVYPGQKVNDYPHSSTSAAINDTYLSSSATATLTVQQTPVTTAPDYPLPQEYWTRPIEAQNTAWATIASNWLVTGGATQNYNVQPDGAAPNTSHIMWTKPLEFGGIVGGMNDTGISGATYYTGQSYEERWSNPIIISGQLFYPLPLGNNGNGGGYVSVDLRTGQQNWYQNLPVNPSFGQLADFESPNQHGIMNGYLWATSGTTWMAYDASSGNALFNLTNVPSGTRVWGPNGEILTYVLDVTHRWLAQWNTTDAITGGPANALTSNGYRPIGKSIDASLPTSYDWNVTLPTTVPAGSSIIKAFADDILLAGTQSAVSTSVPGTGPYTTWAVSLDTIVSGQTGPISLKWIQNYPAPANNVSRQYGVVDGINRVFTTCDKETMQWSGFNLDTGAQMWGPVGPTDNPYQYYSSSITSYNAGAYSTAYGNLYLAGFGGTVYSYDIKTGQLQWTYGNGGQGNSTNSGLTSVWPLRPIFISNIADGKIYLFNSEHSPNVPLYKDAYMTCLNASTGQLIWRIYSWANAGPSFYAQAGVIADGYFAYYNTYDGRIYSIGKGPSAMTVEAPMTAVTLGSSLVIRGTVTDIAAGSKQSEQAARFPNGLPAVSDDSMEQFMEYVYMQKPMPTNATGVPVTISVVDSNGNYRTIGSTTSNTDGFFSYAWTPDIDGTYTVYASFAGSNSYYPSHAVTAFTVDPSVATPTPQPTQAPGMADIYFVPAIAGVFVAIAICIAMIALVLRKHP